MEIERTSAHWFEASVHPTDNGWYPTLNLDGSPTARLWEDGAWWKFTYIDSDLGNEDDGWHLSPNNSLSYWAKVDVPSIVHERPVGAVQ